MVPILTIFLLYWKSENIIREQILISNQNTLNQFFRFIDASMEEMKQVSNHIGNNPTCENYSRLSLYSQGEAGYQTYLVSQVLDGFVDEKYYDLFIYYPHADRIISGVNGSLETDFYFSTFYNSSGYSYNDEIQNILSCEELRPTLYVMNRDGADAYLCVAMRRRYLGNRGKDFVVVQVISPEYMKLFMTETNMQQQNGILLIFDKNQKFLLSNGESRDYDMYGYNGEDTPYETVFGNNRYMMQIKKAEGIDGYYAYATPFHYFWERLLSMRLICILGGMACVFFSTVMVYRGSKRSYRPIENIVQKIEQQENAIYDSALNSEFEFIEGVWENAGKEKSNLNKKLKESEKLRRERFIVSLLESGATGTESGEDDFLKNGIELCSSKFMVVVISVDQNSDMEGEIQSFILKNVFAELCHRKHKGYVAQLTSKTYVVLVNLNSLVNLDEELENWKEGQEFLKKYYQLIVTIAMGEVHEGISEIYHSYREASQALKYRYLLGEGSCIDYGVVKGRVFSYPASVESKLSKMIISYIKSVEPQKNPDWFISDILDIYGIDENASMETVECFKYEMVSVLNKAIMSSSGTIDARNELINSLVAQTTMEKFRENVTSLLVMLCKQERENNQEKDICQKALLYITENYWNSQLSVSMLGEVLNMSSWYLSKLFKDRYGMSIPDCISQTRVKTAKRQLVGTTKSIREIAEGNGYTSSKAFINNFKKWEGITPGVYRELNQVEI